MADITKDRGIKSVAISYSTNEEYKKYVELVCLELSYYCNRTCNYCPIYTMERSDKNLEISEEVLESIVKSLSEIEYDGRISLNLFNEPLASKNILKNIIKCLVSP